MSPPPDPLDDVALAVAEVREITRSGGTADPFAWRERLGSSHGEFLELLEMEAALDRVLDPPVDLPLPRDFGAYRLLRELGRGAVGVVYAAEHRGSGRRAAVKVLRTAFESDPTARERFRRETLNNARVRHDHVVEIYESGEVDHHPYFAMALVEGRPLASLLSAGEAPPPRELARQLAAIADALHAFHQAGIVHRDVKPSNLVVREDGHFFLADFGLARGGEGLTLTGTGEALGTPLYMSPEQLVGKRGEVDGRTDVYALGATLYEALAGHPVFPATDLSGLVGQVLTHRPEPLQKGAGGVPPDLERIALKALEKRKEDRHESAAALRDDLLAFVDGRRVQNGPVGPVRRALRVVRARALVLAASLLVVAGALFLWTHRSARLSITTYPGDVTVLQGGVERGRTPTSLQLDPGPYSIVLRRRGYDDLELTDEIAAGGVAKVEKTMQPRDADARLEVLRALGLEGVPLVRPPLERGTRGADDALLFLSPRGAVALDEVRELAFEMPDPRGFEDGGSIEFRRGTEVLGRITDFRPLNTRGLVPVPKEVRALLRVGDAVTYAWTAPARSGRAAGPARAGFRVVEPVDRPAYERLAATLEGQSDDFDLELRAGWLRAQGRALAATRIADPVADAHPASVRAQAVAYAAYVDLGLADSARARVLAARMVALKGPASDAVLSGAIPLEERIDQVGR